jgi:hypothetical protein
MPWPGAPKSQQSPTINPPSVRYTYPLGDNPTMGDVSEALRVAFNGLTNHEQAFANIPAQITTQATAAATAAVETIENETTAGVTSFNAAIGAILFFPGLGTVNDQLGQTSYAVQQSDAGAKIIVGDSGAVTINFDSGISAPWFCVIDNDSSSVASLVANTGAMNGAKSIYPGGFGIVYFDGSNWWAGATPGGLTVTIPLDSGASASFTNGLLTGYTP